MMTSLTRLLCLERNARKIQGRPNHFQRFRDIQLGMGPGGEGLLLASLYSHQPDLNFR